MADEDIDTSDIPPLSADFFAKAALKLPATDKPVVAVRLDTDTLKWFQNQGEEAENQMAIALRLYAETHREKLAQNP
ncbi:MAG: hypothetical protein ACXW2B_05410 [Methylomagnum sp.]